jgi:hypothetical protein
VKKIVKQIGGINMNINKSILFLGNSYVYYNDLPDMLTNLALSGGHNLFVDSITKGGATLDEFLCEGNELCDALAGKMSNNKWDFVVLQEQSQIPAILEKREEKMYPSVRLLNKKIEAYGGRTVLFMTWGRHFGDSQNGFENFESMQEALRAGYTTIAEEVEALLAPVGIAWAKAKKIDNDIALWDEDCSHPSVMGTYLTACVFYAVILKQSPVGLQFKGELLKEQAELLQKIAIDSVMI